MAIGQRMVVRIKMKIDAKERAQRKRMTLRWLGRWNQKAKPFVNTPVKPDFTIG